MIQKNSALPGVFDFFLLLARCVSTILRRGYGDVLIPFFLIVDFMTFFQWSFGSFYGKHKPPKTCVYIYIYIYTQVYTQLLFLINFHRILQGSLRVVSVDHKWKTIEGGMKTCVCKIFLVKLIFEN